MKKFIDKKVMDWKFRKAGDGHSLSEERKPQPPAKSPSGQGEPLGFKQSLSCGAP